VHEVLGGSVAAATATATPCASQRGVLTTDRASLNVLASVNGRLAGTGAAKAPAELGRAVTSLDSLESALAASSHGHAAAQAFGAALAKVKGTKGLVASSATGLARIGAKEASAKSQTGKAQAALAACEKASH
jgi:hypothetical protein